MPLSRSSSAWWGPPKKFDPNFEERRISWLELFYDLVYVIAIARITHHLALHITWSGFFEYAGLFILIFWGWLNGSLYHDIHGTTGLRTILMTLWQVMIIAALSITIEDKSAKRFEYITIVFMVMQFYITYLWWSVGFYDRALPPFISSILLRRSSLDLSLSSSMFERLGLFTIIVFGEVVLGVVNGISKADIGLFSTWLHFALILSTIFALWWIFFTLISRREAKKGFARASLLELLFIPSLVSLGLIASCLGYFFDPNQPLHSIADVFGYAVAIFLACISGMLGFVDYPEAVRPIKRPFRISLIVTALVFISWSLSGINLGTTNNLVVLLGILVAEIIYLNSLYYSLNVEEGRGES
jgi:low temperature requirement protein LtrA